MAETTVNLGMQPHNRGNFEDLPVGSYIYKDNIVQYHGSSYIYDPANFDIEHPEVSATQSAPYNESPASLNIGWKVFASGNNQFTSGQKVDEIGIDNQPTPSSNNLAKSGSLFNSIIKNGVFDLTAYTGDSYATLSDALTALNNLPAAYKAGGMRFQYVHTSDNKYIQYRLMTTAWSTNTNDWQGTTSEIEASCKDLVESSGIFDKVFMESDGDTSINLWTITKEGGYINVAGHNVDDANFNSCVLSLKSGFTYRIIQQASDNNVRIFSVINGVYTQIECIAGSASTPKKQVDYTCQNSNYVLQVVQRLDLDSGLPVPQIYNLTIPVKNQVKTNTKDIEHLNSIELVEADSLLQQSQIILKLRKNNGTDEVPNYETLSELPIQSASKQKAGLMDSEMYANSFLEIEISSPTDLWEVTTQGGFLNSNGILVSNSSYDSCLLEMESGHTYKIVQQITRSENNVRVYSKSGNTYTQVACIAGTDSPAGPLSEVVYSCENDNYWIQIVQHTPTQTEQPHIYDETTVEVPLKQVVIALKEQVEFNSKKHLRLLAIGNSYSRDALSYVPFLLKDVLDIDVTIGILYMGSCTLQQHYSLINTNGNYEAYDEYSSNVDAWTTITTGNAVKPNTALAKYDWDIITLQQQSSNSRNYSTFQPYLNDIISLILQKINYNVKFGWILTPSYPTGYSGLGGDSSDEMFNKICAAVERVMNETAINFFIPCGTAIQNARYATTLKDLGDYGGLTYEGLHLQEGIPCLLEAYVTTYKLLEMMGIINGIFGNQVRPTQSWVVNKNIPQRNGTSVGVTDTNCMLAQKIASISVKKSLVITDIDSLNL